MILHKPKNEEFEYVVLKPPPARICFGSTLERHTSAIGKNVSAFQRHYLSEPNKLSPFSYETERYKSITNSKNVRLPMLILENGDRIKFRSGARAKRFEDKTIRTPSPTRYEVCYKPEEVKDAKKPFNIGEVADRATYRITSTPGPGTYDTDAKKCRKPIQQFNFGHPTREEIIEMICVSRPRHECTKCGKVCVGDYWQKDYNWFLCTPCWYEEKRTSEIYHEKELKEFKKIRNCSFMHSHEGTDAAITLLTKSKLNKKLRLERYLNNFIKC